MPMVENLIREYGLWAVIVGAMFEGELTLLFAGVLAHYGLFSFGEVILSGTLGGFVGDVLGYLFGHSCKLRINRCEFYRRAQPKLERLSARFGVFAIFLVKYIYGLRTASAIFWGLAPMRFRRFAPLTLASCGAWVLLLAGAGYFFSNAIELVIGRVQQLGVVLLVAFAIAVVIAVAVFLLERYWLARKISEMGLLGLREWRPAVAVPPAPFAAQKVTRRRKLKSHGPKLKPLVGGKPKALGN
jgi:membrane protein DedA with SNARE-associated domain